MFDKQGKTLLKVGNKNGDFNFYSLAGGSPESSDVDRIATLKREFIEEVNTTLLEPVYHLGYQLVDEENGIPPYAQVRMTAMINNIGEKKPDPDCGVTYRRILVEPLTAIHLLNWGEIGEKIIKQAMVVAKNKFGLSFSNIDRYYR